MINWRMCKKHQMGWSRAGAQQLLYVKPAVINGRLDRYTRHHSVRRISLPDPQVLPVSSISVDSNCNVTCREALNGDVLRLWSRDEDRGRSG
jgi:hypothetical protein